MPRLLASALTVIMLAVAGLASAEDTDATRFYFGGRLGGAFLLHREPAPGVKVHDNTRDQVNACVEIATELIDETAPHNQVPTVDDLLARLEEAGITVPAQQLPDGG